MASTKVVSPLSLAEQVAVLQSFLATQSTQLDDMAARNVCTALNLNKPAEATGLARKLKAALGAKGISLKHTHALEALSKLCDLGSWMRARQTMLGLGGSGGEQKCAMQVIETGTEDSQIEVYESLPAVASALLDIVRRRMPAEVAPALCTLHRGPKALTVELERDGGPWVTFHVWAMRPVRDSYELGDLPSADVMAFGRRLERALEYSHPGLLMLATTFCPSLPHWYYLTLLGHGKGEERSTVFTNELEFFVALESLGVRSEPDVEPDTLTVRGPNGEITFQPAWVSGEDESGATGHLLPDQFKSLVQRYFRLRRVSGMPFNKFVLRLAHGNDDGRDFFDIDRNELENARKRTGLSLEDLSRRAGMPTPELLRIGKYGVAHETVIPRLAAALDLPDGNALLPRDDGTSVGLRLQEGTHVLKALSDTHLWTQLVSDNIIGEERDAVEALAESIREYVELVQLSKGELGKTLEGMVPVDEERIAGHLQEALDELGGMGVAVLISKSVKFAKGEGRLTGMNGMALHRSGLYFEKTGKLEPKFTVHPRTAQDSGAAK